MLFLLVISLTNHKITEFNSVGVEAKLASGEIVEIPADTVITAFGMKAESELADKICDRYSTAIIVGDCGKVAQIGGAVRGGFFAGWSIQ